MGRIMNNQGAHHICFVQEVIYPDVFLQMNDRNYSAVWGELVQKKVRIIVDSMKVSS